MNLESQTTMLIASLAVGTVGATGPTMSKLREDTNALQDLRMSEFVTSVLVTGVTAFAGAQYMLLAGAILVLYYGALEYTWRYHNGTIAR